MRCVKARFDTLQMQLVELRREMCGVERWCSISDGNSLIQSTGSQHLREGEMQCCRQLMCSLMLGHQREEQSCHQKQRQQQLHANKSTPT